MIVEQFISTTTNHPPKPEAPTAVAIRSAPYCTGVGVGRHDLAVGVPASPAERAAQGTVDGLWEWCLETDEVWYSDRFCQLIGCDQAKFPAKFSSWNKLLHPDDAPQALRAFDQQVHRQGEAKTESPPLDIDFRLQTKHQGYRWFRVKGVTYNSAGGWPVLISGGMQDVTDHKLAAAELRDKEQQLIQQQRMDAIDCLAGGIAHEFNNLLQAARGYVAFAMDELPIGSQPRDDLDQSMIAIDRATKITRNLLDFSRADETDQETYDVNDIIHGLGEMLRPLIGADVQFRTIACDEGLRRVGDLLALRQAMLNLCINARDAMPHGGELLVRGERFDLSAETAQQIGDLQPGAYCRLMVTDSGTGMDRETQKRIFDPFFTTKEIGRGTGLGLASVYGFARGCDGHVAVHSELGVGTTFCLYLPLSGEPLGKNAMPYEPYGEELNADQPYRLLLAEDDPQVLEVARRTLMNAGYQVTCAADGRVAMEAIDRQGESLDLVLLDAVMPHYSGIEVFEQLRLLPTKPPVIFCTGYDPASAQGHGVNQLGDAVLMKPFDRTKLLTVIKTLLDRRPPRVAQSV